MAAVGFEPTPPKRLRTLNPAPQQEGHGFDSCIGHCWLSGAGPPQSAQCTVLRWAISRVFLCGVCMFFQCSQGVSSTKHPKRKTCKIPEHMSIPDQRWTVHFTWSLGATSCPLLLGGPGGRMLRDGSNAERTFHSDLRPACVCVLCRLHKIHVCVAVCRLWQ